MLNRLPTLRLAFIVALALSMLNARWLPAQVSETSTATNHNIWFAYSGEHKLGRNIDLLLDETVRRANGLRLWQQLELSQGLDYDLSRDLRFAAGYTFVETYPYGALAIAITSPGAAYRFGLLSAAKAASLGSATTTDQLCALVLRSVTEALLVGATDLGTPIDQEPAFKEASKLARIYRTTTSGVEASVPSDLAEASARRTR